MNNIIFYDLEIYRAIPDRDGRREPGFQYCGGWSDYENMGISCLCAYDLAREMPLVYCADNLTAFRFLAESGAWLVGFNNARFDNRVLRLNGIEIPEDRTVDLLAEIWKANGLDPDSFEWQTHGGYSLDACMIVNFNECKSGNGALAPIEWQQGKIGSVISYCLRDVMLTFKLWRKIVTDGEIINLKTGQKLKVTLPQLARQEVSA